MKKRKVRDKGKLKLSSYFKKFSDGDLVCVVRDLGVAAAFPSRITGKSGKVVGSRGKYKMIELKDGAKMKTFIIHPIHLRKLKNGN
jgi:large subunit ribosomal protein L21e